MEIGKELKHLAAADSKAAAAEEVKPVQLVKREGEEAAFLVYATADGVRAELRFEGGEPWFTQAQLAKMFGVSVPTTNEHIRKFLLDGELDESTIRKFRIVRREGDREVTRELDHYGLDVAFYVGYRVNSQRGALFRRWATDVLVRFAKYGHAIDVERLKAPADSGVVDELKEIVREIRASTQNVYREVRRIVSLCQDYDSTSAAARDFYAHTENKLLYLSCGMTAPDLILERADAAKPDMGLTHYGGRRGPTQADAKIANNYLAPGEARLKNRATIMLLDYFEEQLDQRRLVTMAEAEEKLDGFIKFNNWPLLRGHGSVQRAKADCHAIEQHKAFAGRE